MHETDNGAIQTLPWEKRNHARGVSDAAAAVRKKGHTFLLHREPYPRSKLKAAWYARGL